MGRAWSSKVLYFYLFVSTKSIVLASSVMLRFGHFLGELHHKQYNVNPSVFTSVRPREEFELTEKYYALLWAIPSFRRRMHAAGMWNHYFEGLGVRQCPPRSLRGNCQLKKGKPTMDRLCGSDCVDWTTQSRVHLPVTSKASRYFETGKAVSRPCDA